MSIVSPSPPVFRTVIDAFTVAGGTGVKYERGPTATPGGGTVVVTLDSLNRVTSLLDVNRTTAVSASPGLTAAGTVTSTMTVVFLPGSSGPVSGMPSLSVSVSGVLSAFSRSTVQPWTPSVLVASNVSGPEMPMFLTVNV